MPPSLPGEEVRRRREKNKQKTPCPCPCPCPCLCQTRLSKTRKERKKKENLHTLPSIRLEVIHPSIHTTLACTARHSAHLIATSLSSPPAEEIHHASGATAAPLVALLVRVAEPPLIGADAGHVSFAVLTADGRSCSVAVVAEVRWLLASVRGRRVWRSADWEVGLDVRGCGGRAVVLVGRVVSLDGLLCVSAVAVVAVLFALLHGGRRSLRLLGEVREGFLLRRVGTSAGSPLSFGFVVLGIERVGAAVWTAGCAATKSHASA